MRFGKLERIVGDDGIGRLWLIDANGEAFGITRKLLRESGVMRPAIGDAFEFLAKDGAAAQLRKVAA